MEKLYKFAYDLQTGQYMGVTRDFLQAGHGLTDIQPHFQQGFKTIFSTENNYWHLVRDEQFFNQMSVKDKLAEQDLFCMVKISELSSLISRYHDNNNENVGLVRDVMISKLDGLYFNNQLVVNHLKTLAMEHIKFEKQMRENHDFICSQIRELKDRVETHGNFGHERFMILTEQIDQTSLFYRAWRFLKNVFSRERS